MGGKGRVAGARWHKEIADGGEDTDEALQASAIESPASPARAGGRADANSPRDC